jgi:hypothetical protein
MVRFPHSVSVAGEITASARSTPAVSRNGVAAVYVGVPPREIEDLEIVFGALELLVNDEKREIAR